MSEYPRRVFTEEAPAGDLRAQWEAWELAAFSQEEQAAIRRVTLPKGRSPWVRVRCHGHDVEHDGRVTRLRLVLAGSAVRLVFDTRGAVRPLDIVVEVDGDRGGGSALERWRLTCPVCGRSGDRNVEALFDDVLRALWDHCEIRSRGRDHRARVSWWAHT